MLKFKFLILIFVIFKIDCNKIFREKRHENSAVYAIQGRRDYMEDRFFINEHLNKSTKIAIFSIFDGHNGDFASKFAKKMLMKSLSRKIIEINEIIHKNITEISKVQNYIKDNQINYKKLIRDEILATDNELIELLKQKNIQAGSTALIAIIEDSKLIVANVGDSRAIMCDHLGKVVQLSNDHLPNKLKEFKRIKNAGGFIKFDGVWRVNGILATSRSLGDYDLKPEIVIAKPEVLKFDLLQLLPKFIILASDGLWEIFTNEEAVDFIKTKIHEPHFGAKSLALKAFERGSFDNITVIVIIFRNGNFFFGSSK